MRGLLISSASALLFVAACFTGGSPSNPDAGPVINNVTYYKDVAPIVQGHCQGCHVQGGIGAFPLLTYDDAKANAPQIVYETGARKMPPWGASNTSECTTRYGFKNDPTLSDAQIQTLNDWHAGGDKAGDPKDAPPPNTTPPITDLPNATSLAPTTPYTLQGTADYFRCFVLDPQLATDTYMTGTYIKPGNSTIVHHALIFAVPANATIPPPDDGVPNQYTCFGSSEVSGQQLVAVWAPGMPPYQFPTDVAHPLKAGTKLIMQIHYHPHANATPDPDTTTFQFATTNTKPVWTVDTALLGNFPNALKNGIGLENPPFLIQPDQAGQVFTMRYTEPPLVPTVRLLAVAAHMHLVGVDEKITLTRAAPTATDPADECMLQVPSWNFNWQRSYEYDAPIDSLPTFSAGDEVRVRCTYDNTMNNLFLAQALSEANKTQTQPVTLGETTLDEMCLGAFWIVYKTP
jgi:hypothetical protein